MRSRWQSSPFAPREATFPHHLSGFFTLSDAIAKLLSNGRFLSETRRSDGYFGRFGEDPGAIL